MFDQIILNLGAMLLNYPNLGTYFIDYEEKDLKKLFTNWKNNNKDISEQMMGHLKLLERRLFEEDESWEYDEENEEKEEEEYDNYHDIDEDILQKMSTLPKASSKLKWWTGDDDWIVAKEIPSYHENRKWWKEHTKIPKHMNRYENNLSGLDFKKQSKKKDKDKSASQVCSFSSLRFKYNQELRKIIKQVSEIWGKMNQTYMEYFKKSPSPKTLSDIFTQLSSNWLRTDIKPKNQGPVLGTG